MSLRNRRPNPFYDIVAGLAGAPSAPPKKGFWQEYMEGLELISAASTLQHKKVVEEYEHAKIKRERELRKEADELHEVIEEQNEKIRDNRKMIEAAENAIPLKTKKELARLQAEIDVMRLKLQLQEQMAQFRSHLGVDAPKDVDPLAHIAGFDEDDITP